MTTVYRQWRMITGFEIVNQTLSVLLVSSTTGVTLWLWTKGQVGVGAVAARRWPCGSTVSRTGSCGVRRVVRARGYGEGRHHGSFTRRQSVVDAPDANRSAFRVAKWCSSGTFLWHRLETKRNVIGFRSPSAPAKRSGSWAARAPGKVHASQFAAQVPRRAGAGAS